MQSTTTLELNLQYPNHATTMYAVQNDRLSRTISAVLADGATAWTPPTGSLAIVRFIKPDGTMGFYDTDENDDPAVTWTGNVATIMLAEQVLTVAGDVWCQVNFYNAGEERLSTFKWLIKVQENVITDETIESTDYFNILTHQIDEIIEAITEMPVPSTSTPLMDGTASVGTETKFARGDHRHPTDTSRVPTTRKVNNKALSSDVTLSASDVGAVPTTRKVNSKALSSDITLSASDVSAVPTTRKVNNKALSSDITLSASDVGAVPTTRTVNGEALSSNVTLNASDIPNDSTVSGENVDDALDNLNGAITFEATARQNAIDALPTSRLKGKKIAIYADSWGNPSYGSLGKDYLEDLTGETIHLSWQGSQTMAQLYTNCWDSYNADIYIINGGLNDFGNNGTITAYKTAISNFVTAMRTVNANCEIYFITPEFIRTSTQQTQLYPLEAYRSAIWGLKNLYKYNVVNSLKWVNISYQSDNVHPLATDADTIGAYIASALINYGDEETHITEFTTLGNLKSNQLILYMIGGSPYLYFQQFTATANSTDRYPIDITALSYDMGFFQLCAMNGQTGDPAIVYHVISDVNYINVYSKGVGTGNTIAVNGLLVPTYFRSLTMPGTF